MFKIKLTDKIRNFLIGLLVKESVDTTYWIDKSCNKWIHVMGENVGPMYKSLYINGKRVF